MRIIRIILSGFKSYGKRTSLSRFSKNLNCITGFNGSGKSNILDAICFVLGLQSFSLARVDKLQEFIYKNGQSGITEATVSIVFRDNKGELGEQIWINSDRDIIVSRTIKRDRSKFTLNGKTITLTKIKKLFKSIGLNMDNPSSFFVKQGTISNIVHFKPSDLLELIEECAGVNYYNGIRKHFSNVIDRQDRKMESIEDIYSGDLHPEVLRLKNEVRVLGEYQHCQAELKIVRHSELKLRRLVTHNQIEKLNKTIKEKSNQAKDIISERRVLYKEIEKIEAKLEMLEKEEKQVKAAPSHNDKLEQKQQILASKIKKIESLKQRSISIKEARIEEFENALGNFKKKIALNQTQLRVSTSKLETIKDQLKAKNEYLKKLNSIKKGSSSKKSKLLLIIYV